MDFKDKRYFPYVKSKETYMTTYEQGDTLPEEVSISKADLENGSPKEGDMIAMATNSVDPEIKDMWLISKEYFENNYVKVNKVWKNDNDFESPIKTLN